MNHAEMNKKKFVILSVVIMAVTVLTLAAVAIYKVYFEKNIEAQKVKKEIHAELDKAAAESAEINKASLETAKKHGMLGSYITTRNENVEGAESSYMYTPTTKVTHIMELKEDMTVSYEDDSKGYWIAKEDENGLVTLSIIDRRSSDINSSVDYLYYDGILIDTTMATYWGSIPEGDVFDAEMTMGDLTFNFKSDGTVDLTYSDESEDATQQGPYSEAYRGFYHRNGDYLEMIINSNDNTETTTFLFFKTFGNDPQKPVSGLASSYYIRSDLIEQ